MITYLPSMSDVKAYVKQHYGDKFRRAKASVRTLAEHNLAPCKCRVYTFPARNKNEGVLEIVTRTNGKLCAITY